MGVILVPQLSVPGIGSESFPRPGPIPWLSLVGFGFGGVVVVARFLGESRIGVPVWTPCPVRGGMGWNSIE
ncbi:hypothetical protein ACFL6U_09160 [Planctomycetota bacterium]